MSLQPGQTSEPQRPLTVEEMQFWLDKAVAWGETHSAESQRDTCLHLGRLRGFVQQLLTHIDRASSTADAMKGLPGLGQLLGRLLWNPYVTADDSSRRLLLQCLWGLFSEHPADAVERTANQWIRTLLRRLATEDDDATAAPQTLLKCFGESPKDYRVKVLKRKVALLRQNTGKSCALLDTNQRCSCDAIMTTSQACVPLVTCPEAAPLIGALLQRSVACVGADLSEDFLRALSAAYSSKCCELDEEAVISLWYHSLPSLEEAVLSLLESVLTATKPTPLTLQRQDEQSLLAKGCAQHSSMLLVVHDIFRTILKQAEGSRTVKYFIQAFTRCFLRELALLPQQMSVSLKCFFPQSPHSLLVPLLSLPSEMHCEAWRRHLTWLSGRLQRASEEEEEADADGGTVKGHYNLFETWFLLVQCAHWVEVAVRLLVTSSPENCGPLLWLLTFFYHPTNRGHHRASLMVVAWSGLTDEARCALSSLEPTLNGGSGSPSDADRVHVRIKELQTELTHMDAA
ncbi:Fanconi anemia group C protein isoform X2 [Nelusetta ayraudi]|uniref:Fanconi anemia group C protein isoform X2 n=1 Tax=Nelusetta ayraudi TaxID=303726 RepID=UPI003F6E4A4D